jgi:hypothetical protein
VDPSKQGTLVRRQFETQTLQLRSLPEDAGAPFYSAPVVEVGGGASLAQAEASRGKQRQAQAGKPCSISSNSSNRRQE